MIVVAGVLAGCAPAQPQAPSSLSCVPDDIQKVIYNLSTAFDATCQDGSYVVTTVVNGTGDLGAIEAQLGKGGYSQLTEDPGDGSYANGGYDNGKYLVNFAIQGGGPADHPDGWVVQYTFDPE